MAKAKFDARTDPDVPAGMSLELLADLHLLTRDGQLNQDARRKLKQVRHLIGLLRPALDDVLARATNPGEPAIVDCGAGKSYLGFLLYELVLGPAQKGTLWAVEARDELVAAARQRASKFGYQRFTLVDGNIASASLPSRLQVVTALHACDTATDDAILLGVNAHADHIAVVPCCQAEFARQLATAKVVDPIAGALFDRNLHRREFGSHLTNVVRALFLEARGYHVTVTELVGWEHSAKNELILAKRVGHHNAKAQKTLDELVARFGLAPMLLRQPS